MEARAGQHRGYGTIAFSNVSPPPAICWTVSGIARSCSLVWSSVIITRMFGCSGIFPSGLETCGTAKSGTVREGSAASSSPTDTETCRFIVHADKVTNRVIPTARDLPRFTRVSIDQSWNGPSALAWVNNYRNPHLLLCGGDDGTGGVIGDERSPPYCFEGPIG